MLGEIQISEHLSNYMPPLSYAKRWLRSSIILIDE